MGEDFTRICETLGEDLQGFARIRNETLGENLQGFHKDWDEDLQDFGRGFARICETLGEDSLGENCKDS